MLRRLSEWNRLRRDMAKAAFARAVVSYCFELDLEVDSERHNPRHVAARRIAMYLCHVGFGMSLARVGTVFERDRATVGQACRLVEDRRERPRFEGFIAALEETIHTIPQPDEELQALLLS